MSKPKYQIGEKVEVDFGHAKMSLEIYGLFDNIISLSWEYCCCFRTNNTWSKLWLSEEYLDKHGKVICANQSTKLET